MVSQSFSAREFLIYGFKPPQDQQLIPKGVTDAFGSLKLKCSVQHKCSWCFSISAISIFYSISISTINAVDKYRILTRM